MMKSRILVIGGTGNIGRHLVAASLDAGHPTAVLVRPSTAASSDSGKAELLNSFKARGACIVYGDMNDHGSLVAAMRQHGEVVICAVGHGRPLELDGQLKIVEAIQEAGCVKRFVPSEFGCDVEHAEQTLEPAKSMMESKLRVRQVIREVGIPHTIICSNWAIGLLLSGLGENGPLSTGVNIFGDDEKTRAIFLDEKDMSRLAIRAVEDPRTLDKVLYVRPPTNVCSFGQLVHLLEKKTGKTLERHYVPEQDLAKKIQAGNGAFNLGPFRVVHGRLRRVRWVEATQLYPDVRFVTVEEYLDGIIV
uniref:Uncharacterized protein n=1 Tax=Avena sativa TaxID=4498 RepID=A0ACD6A9P1_AVESA